MSLPLPIDFRTPFYLFATLNVTLAAGTAKTIVKVHEYVLIAQSPFFKAALTSGFQESKAQHISLPEIKPEILTKVLRWLYRAKYWESEGTINDTKYKNDVADFFKVCGFLGIPAIINNYLELIVLKMKLPECYFTSNLGPNIAVILHVAYQAGGRVELQTLKDCVALLRSNRGFQDFRDIMERITDLDGKLLRSLFVVYGHLL
ncbi:hypothetical protein TWF694_002688 [Orbilia ellipsospora]|uniref:BTB domain-containing protein n=1 Tax=Orbilia ellipsospora TaxID=2528407 RepID=A0AAV9X424_9PEZI